MAVSILYPSRRFGLGRRPGQGFTYQIENCLQMRHGFDNMFQNAFKCDMVSTTCSKMLSNATWFRQHVPKCSQMRRGFDNMFRAWKLHFLGLAIWQGKLSQQSTLTAFFSNTRELNMNSLGIPLAFLLNSY